KRSAVRAACTDRVTAGCASAWGKGNLFVSFCSPARKQFPLTSPVQGGEGEMNARRILVVEDEASIAEVVQLYLRRAGFQVQIAPDGRTALDALAVQIPDLVV